MTVIEAIELIRDQLDEDSEKFWKDDIILKYLNLARRNIFNYVLLYNPLFCVSEVVVSVPAGQMKVELPVECKGCVTSVYDSGVRCYLQPMDILDARNHVTYTGANATHFSVQGGKLVLWPTPTAACSYVVSCAGVPVDLALDSADAIAPSIMEPAVLLKALIYCKRKDCLPTKEEHYDLKELKRQIRVYVIRSLKAARRVSRA